MLLYSAGSEIAAIYALYQQQAAHSTAQAIFIAVTFMVIITAAGPTLAYWRAVVVPIARGGKWLITSQPLLNPVLLTDRVCSRLARQ